MPSLLDKLKEGVSGDSAFTGGLAGILASTVFGGPVGLAVGLGTGILSNRMQRSELDVLADDYEGIQKYASSIQDQINATSGYVDQYGDPSGSDRMQLDSISREMLRANDLAQRVDPNIRAVGLQQLTNAANRFDAFHSDLESRTQKLADDQLAAEQKVADHFQSEFEGTQAKVRDANDLANRAQMLVADDHDIKNPQTKAVLMQMFNISQREADQDAMSWSVGLLGTGLSGDVNDFNPTYDQALKMIETYRATTIASGKQYLSQIVDLAHQSGYEFGASKDGTINVRNINSVVQQFKSVQPTSVAAPSPAPASTPSPTDALNNAMNGGQAAPAPGQRTLSAPSGGKYPTADAIAGSINAIPDKVSESMNELSGKGSKAIKDWQDFVSEAIHRKRGPKRRPTNQ